ncbi:MAG: allophanate hydrolase subunit 1 [Austwickia sp.]|nr:allophanate hydrolase subunit 1 [Austwickia sp.]
MRVLPCGADAVLLEFADGAEALAYRAGLEAAPLADVAEVVPGARTVLLRGRDATAMPGVIAAARAVQPRAATASAAGEVRVPVTYDGADLAEVAGLLGCSPEALVARHTELTWNVAFCGFSPGFAYLTCPDAGWVVPRRQSPRTRVPAGSVGLAGEYCGCYPTPSPGGWQLIGRTDARLWDSAADPPALLAPGTRVRFIATPAVAR